MYVESGKVGVTEFNITCVGCENYSLYYFCRGKGQVEDTGKCR